MADKQLSREEQLIAFIVSQCSGRIGRTQLMKFLYLADYESRRYLGRSLSNIDYVWYHYGPYDKTLNSRIEKLEKQGVLSSKEEQFPTGKTGYRYSVGPTEVAYSLDPDALMMLSYVCDTYSDLPLQALLDEVVYETEPMKEAQEKNRKNSSLNMAIVDNAKRYELGVPFDELLARSREARLGKKVSWEEMMERLNPSRTHAAA